MTIKSIFTWFAIARPAVTTKSFNAQMGTHFEEVGEMIAEIEGLDGETSLLLERAKQAVNELGSHLKNRSKEQIVRVPEENRVRYLDALCDQIVTATGCAYDNHMDIAGALDTVNRSNYSKFVNGKAVFDENGKIAKGPDYFKADLSAYA